MAVGRRRGSGWHRRAVSRGAAGDRVGTVGRLPVGRRVASGVTSPQWLMETFEEKSSIRGLQDSELMMLGSGELDTEVEWTGLEASTGTAGEQRWALLQGARSGGIVGAAPGSKCRVGRVFGT